MKTQISESCEGYADNMKWEVAYYDGTTSISYLKQREGDTSRQDVSVIRLGNYVEMDDVITNNLFSGIPREYVPLIGDSLAGTQRVFNAIKAMKNNIS